MCGEDDRQQVDSKSHEHLGAKRKKSELKEKRYIKETLVEDGKGKCDKCREKCHIKEIQVNDDKCKNDELKKKDDIKETRWRTSSS
ncbi:hypothetical protein LR48_Vigan02g183100 [Vigna angularis]|uniref:Uncharacterized protein n=1 Tax=Phaseolus angularis TaxID=3914 RepID=A0A0L9TYV0_PHAAN|nr:uncharacterized protein HKW66_Vig0191250 [Vigna angularis]KOM35681.1 hypothetical protein LR48_Vigan02g183100 [Vigna angularis]